jgi:serine/threonine protein phosphatase PrpC
VVGRTVRLAVFDGTTDDGSGSGYAAARSAVQAVNEAWNRDLDDPAAVLARAEKAVCAGAAGASTAVVARAVDGQVYLASLGDSAAWLVRPDPGGRDFVAWRLTPSHTVFAEKSRAGVTDAWDESVITRFLGGAGDDPFRTEFGVAAGDLLVLATDGATAQERDEWFGDVLCRLARERVAAQRPLAAGLAADLISRAEALGGWDNATALVTQFDEA